MKDQFYIVANQAAGNYGVPEYYCISPTQGEQLVPFAYSMAKRFDNSDDAREVCTRLSAEYKGLRFTIQFDPQ